MTDGDESHSEFTFTGFVLAGLFPACIGFFRFVILRSGVPHTSGHRASLIFYSMNDWFVACRLGGRIH